VPTITVEGPPIHDIARKRDLARRLTDVAVEVYGIPHITVLINGELICDRKTRESPE